MNAKACRELIDAALAAQKQAYCRYSQFPVGAALMSTSGEVFPGCNIENASYGLTICAERTALFSAVAAGHRQFVMLAIASPGGAAPCGACRQVLAEFAPNLPIMLISSDDPMHRTEVNLRDLLPRAFSFSPPEP